MKNLAYLLWMEAEYSKWQCSRSSFLLFTYDLRPRLFSGL